MTAPLVPMVGYVRLWISSANKPRTATRRASYRTHHTTSGCARSSMEITGAQAATFYFPADSAGCRAGAARRSGQRQRPLGSACLLSRTVRMAQTAIAGTRCPARRRWMVHGGGSPDRAGVELPHPRYQM
jgi:hypothetical protein